MYNSFLYSLVRLLLRAFIRVFIRFDVQGRGNIPSRPGFLLVSNHISYLDPFLIGAAIPYQLHFMAKREAFAKPLMGRIITALGAFSVERNRADIAALRNSIRLLISGEVVAIFPPVG